MSINNKSFRSTLVALTFGALVTALPVAADSVSFTTSSNPASFGVGSYAFSFNDATVTNETVGLTPTVLNGTTTTTSFGGFTVSGAPGQAASQVVDVFVKPTNIDGTPVTTASPLQFDGKIVDTAGVYSLVFSAGNGATAGTGAYSGDIIQTQGNLIYAVKATTTLNTGKSFFVTGLIGTAAAVVPEPATFATTGLAVALVGMFLRRRAKLNS